MKYRYWIKEDASVWKEVTKESYIEYLKKADISLLSLYTGGVEPLSPGGFATILRPNIPLEGRVTSGDTAKLYTDDAVFMSLLNSPSPY